MLFVSKQTVHSPTPYGNCLWFNIIRINVKWKEAEDYQSINLSSLIHLIV